MPSSGNQLLVQQKGRPLWDVAIHVLLDAQIVAIMIVLATAFFLVEEVVSVRVQVIVKEHVVPHVVEGVNMNVIPHVKEDVMVIVKEVVKELAKAAV